MSTQPLDNNVANLLASAGDDFSQTQPDAGYGFGGEWPPQGEHLVTVDNIRITADSFRLGREDYKIPVVEITFQYTEMEPRTAEGAERPAITFWGKPISYAPKIPANAEEKIRGMLERERSRLMNHLSKLLNVDPRTIVDVRTALETLSNNIASESVLAAKVHCDYYYKSEGARPFRTDYIRENCSV